MRFKGLLEESRLWSVETRSEVPPQEERLQQPLDLKNVPGTSRRMSAKDPRSHPPGLRHDLHLCPEWAAGWATEPLSPSW